MPVRFIEIVSKAAIYGMIEVLLQDREDAYLGRALPVQLHEFNTMSNYILGASDV